jgi:hypothetical protein
MGEAKRRKSLGPPPRGLSLNARLMAPAETLTDWQSNFLSEVTADNEGRIFPSEISKDGEKYQVITRFYMQGSNLYAQFVLPVDGSLRLTQAETDKLSKHLCKIRSTDMVARLDGPETTSYYFKDPFKTAYN